MDDLEENITLEKMKRQMKKLKKKKAAGKDEIKNEIFPVLYRKSKTT